MSRLSDLRLQPLIYGQSKVSQEEKAQAQDSANFKSSPSQAGEDNVDQPIFLDEEQQFPLVGQAMQFLEAYDWTYGPIHV